MDTTNGPAPAGPSGPVATQQPARRPGRQGRWPVVAWGLWDWGGAAFNAVITTFVFTVYLTSDAFGPGASSKLGWALAGAGAVVALLAPITGQRADRSGRRTFWLGVNTALVVLASAGMFFVRPSPDYLWLGLVLLAAGNVFFEFASVNYNAMLGEVSAPGNVGRISGLGWGLGYVGGIVLLLIVYFGLISPQVGLFGVTSEAGLDVRVTVLLCAGWTLLFSLPVLFTLRDDPSLRQRREPWARPVQSYRIVFTTVAKVWRTRPLVQSYRIVFATVADVWRTRPLVQSYRTLFATVADLWRTDRNTVYFLGASAVFRDGLAGVFTFGAVIAASVFGFSAGGVIVFGVAANLVAGAATIGFGVLDDVLGPKRVIVLALASMTVAGVVLFALHDSGTVVFWVFGLLLSVFVGPAQSASRTFLARLIPAGREGQVFGLYATTGRAVSFLAPAMFSLSIWVGTQVTGGSTEDAEYWGILGIVLVVAAGLALLLPVRSATRSDSLVAAHGGQRGGDQ